MFTSHRRYTEEDEAENDRAAVSGALWVNDLYISISQIASLGGSGSNPRICLVVSVCYSPPQNNIQKQLARLTLRYSLG